MNLFDLISNEPALSIAATVLGGVWTFFKSTEAYEKMQQRRVGKALRILESAAEATYRTYVRQVKKASRDGKLSDEEARHARELAKEKAIKIARRKGINLVRELGEDFLELALTRAVNKLKNAQQ